LSARGWIGVDLDGTLAYYDCWRGVDHIGAPVPAMLLRVKGWLMAGEDVRIFTARASDPAAVPAIDAWCLEHVGRVLPVTNVKDFQLVVLYDDRAIGVEANTGRLIGACP
jgi:hypothetical protein